MPPRLGGLMGYRLRREMRDALPPKLLTDGERHVLYEIADFANDDTRAAYPGMDELVRATHFDAKTIGVILARLARKGIELRVATGKDKLGRPVYACRGHRTTYLIPRLVPVDNSANGPTAVGPLSEKGPTIVKQRSNDGCTMPQPPLDPSPQESSSEPSSSARAGYRQRIADVAGVETDDEIDSIVEQIKNSTNGPVRNLGALVNSIPADDLMGHAAAAREAAEAKRSTYDRARAEAHRKWSLTQSSCRHGVDGGWLIRPLHGTPGCPNCRIDYTTDPTQYLTMVYDRREAEGVDEPDHVINPPQPRPVALVAASTVRTGPYRDPDNASEIGDDWLNGL